MPPKKNARRSTATAKSGKDDLPVKVDTVPKEASVRSKRGKRKASASQQTGNQESGDQESGDQEGGDQEGGNQESGNQESGNKETGNQESGNKETGNQEGAKGEVSQDPPQRCHWLMKSEPESRIENGIDVKFGIEDLKALPNQSGSWDGVRSYQARNFMREMKDGQTAFFYHSNCKEPGIAGVMKVVKEAYVDHTQFDKKDAHFDPSSKPDNPKWSMVDVQYERMLKRFIPLSELKKYHLQHKAKGGPLKGLALFTRARLSIQPLTSEEFDFVLSLEDKEPL